jgi:hypothetical protein
MTGTGKPVPVLHTHGQIAGTAVHHASGRHVKDGFDHPDTEFRAFRTHMALALL